VTAADRLAPARRWPALRVAAAALGVALLAAAIIQASRNPGDVQGWLAQIWARIAAVPPAYVVAACGLKAAEVALNAAAWTAVLRAAYPDQHVTFRQALAVVQGGIAIVAVIPPKVGGVAVLGLYRAAFPALGIAALLATRTVQGLAASVLGLGLLAAFGVTIAGGPAGVPDQIAALINGQPLVAGAATAIALGLAILLVRRGRARLGGLARQLAVSGAILRRPGRYALLVAAPSALAFACRWGVTAVLLAAFAFPVNLETLMRVNIAHGLARSVQIAPGGLGTTQAFDLVALKGLAAPDVIVSYSLAQAALLLAFNVAFGLAALTWAFGWSRAARLLVRRSPGHEAASAPA
jgi:lysylphosphatidylglycerol synthase-like protein